MVKEWFQKCKDCGIEFGYSDYSLQSDLKKGLSRPERCKDCRDKHGKEINSIASSHFGLISRKEKRPILGLPYLGHIEHGTRILRDETKEPDTSGMDIGMTPKHMKRIYEALKDHQVLVIVAPTGTGKSTYIPFLLIEPLDGYEKDEFTKHGPIIVTQPRIAATSGISKAIGEKLLGSHVGPGFEIGYRHGDRSGEKKGEVFDKRNRLLFVTDGSLLNWITEGKIGDYSMIIVDEAHERSSNIDLILGLTKRELLKYPHLKLIISSATIDTDRFVKYFDEVTTAKLLNFSDCQKFYGYDEYPWKIREISKEDMSEQVTKKNDPEIENQLKSYQENIIKQVADKVLDILSETDEGGILGFLPGQKEIKDAVQLIKDGIKMRNIKGVRVYPLYAELGEKGIDSACKEFEESDRMIIIGNKRVFPRRVVIATNIAETSITIKDMVYVVDSGLIKQSEWNPTTCRQELKTRFHSKDGCKQRWGRAGRVQKGFAHKLYTKENFIKYFLDHTSPEITRECLDDVILKAKASGVQDVDPSKFSWIEKPPEDELNRALNVFNKRRLVDSDNDMTEEGREVYRLSKRISRFLDDYDHNSTNRALDVATMLILADKYACLIEAVTALVMMPRMGNSLYWNEGLLLWDKKWDIQSKDHIIRLHNELRMGCSDDLDFACKLFALYEGEISDIPDAVLNSWSQRYFINEENFFLVKEARNEILAVFIQGKKSDVLRPIDFSLVERVRLLMAIAWPDRIVSIKKGSPLRFVLDSKTKMEGILSENAIGNWANQKKVIVAMMDQSNIVINGNKKGVPVASFLIQTPEGIPSKEATDIISKLIKLRNQFDPQKTLFSLFTHLHVPIGAWVNVDSSSKQLKISDAVLPNVFQPTFDKSLSTKDEADFDSSELYDHERYPKSRERRKNKKGKSLSYSSPIKKRIEIKSNFEIRWSNKTTGDKAFVENWKDYKGKQIVILNTIDPATDNRETLKKMRMGNKLNLILKRPVFDMLQRKIIGFIAENKDGITFPISTSNLSIQQNNPGLYRLENQKLEFRFFGVDSLTNYPHFSILSKLETDLKNLIEKNEVEAYVERITVENIYFSIMGNERVTHSARQPLSFISEFISDLSIGKKVILNIESLVEKKGNVNIDIESTLSSENVKILEEFGIRVEKHQLSCDKPIPCENLRKIQDLLPELSSDLRGLYTLSHLLKVYIVEIPKVFKALQKEALEIKNMASVNGDQLRVKEMQKKINSRNVRLSNESYQVINNILNDAWKLSSLPFKKSFLIKQKANLVKNKERLRKGGTVSYENRVKEWIAEGKYTISRIKKEIKELEDLS